MTYESIGDIPMNELAHYGVKGMKWGVRRTPEQLGKRKPKKKKVTTKDISEARSRHNARLDSINRQVSRGNIIGTKAAKTEAASQIRKIAKEALESGDISTASRLTKGEKVTNTLIGGPLGALTLYSAVKSNKVRAHNAKVILDVYSTIKVEDFPDD